MLLIVAAFADQVQIHGDGVAEYVSTVNIGLAWLDGTLQNGVDLKNLSSLINISSMFSPLMFFHQQQNKSTVETA
jgi:hypothetical protein